MATPPATGRLRDARRSSSDVLRAIARRIDLPIVGFWLLLAGGLAVVTSQVADWYVMTDELLYERLAISIANLHSPLPHVHGELIGNINQLYPLLLAPLFHDRLVPAALYDAHLLNAFVMSSAAIPAFVLARKVTQSSRLSYLVAVLSVCIPWIAISSFLMTEVVAYPAFIWAALALHVAVVSPRARNDVVLLLVLALAILARAQFAVLLVVPPLALLVHHVMFASARSIRARLRSGVAEAASAHRVLAVAYAVLVLAAVVLLAAGQLSSALGTYSDTARGNVLPSGMGRALLEHVALIGLGTGILPFVVGVAWLLTALARPGSRELHAFACIATVTFVALLLEVTSYDVRFGEGRLHDRYLFYVVPLVLIAAAAWIPERRSLRWPLFLSAGLLAAAFAFLPVVRYEKFNVDSPVAVLNDWLLDLGGSVNGARLFLVFATIVTALLATLVRPRRLVLLLLAVTALAIPTETALALNRLFTVDGTSGRPLTLDQGGVFDWVDRELSPTARVTMIPYPLLYGEYWANVAYWWNVEFWNASVQRAALYEDAFTGTPKTFPATVLGFDRATGRADVSPSDYVLQPVAETRFHIVGKSLANERGVTLVKAGRPWRTDWLTFDLYRDGWTIPRVTGKIRVFAAPGQTGRTRRFLTISVRAPQDVAARGFRVSSNASDWRGRADAAGTSNQISVCVPAHGFADVHVEAPHYSPIYGDPKSAKTFASYARSGGVLVTAIALADETSAC